MSGKRASRGIPASRHAVTRVTDRALLLRAVPVGEADVMLLLFTAGHGTASAAARGARRSARRFGALEPLHELMVTLEIREGAEIAKLCEARIERPRLAITRDLDRLEAAGQILRWVRRACSLHVPEPSIFEVVTHGLDALDAEEPLPARSVLGATGLAICDGLGWGLELERCVGCGKACPLGAPSRVDPQRGGLVCRACGGARRVLSSEVRAALRAVGILAAAPVLEAKAAEVAIELVDALLDAHVGPVPATKK